MASTRTTFTLDDDLAAQARELDVNVSAAARAGVAAAAQAARAERDRTAYERMQEQSDDDWATAEVWASP
jgi:post-segregation antitoxin (ccd killing protein)